MLVNHLPWRLIAALVLAFAAQHVNAANDPVLIENGTVKVHRSDYLLELDRLPENMRGGFANSERRVNDLLRKMLLERTLAAQARDEKLHQIPENAARLAAETDRMHTLLKVLKIEAEAGAAFDAERARWEARVKELYTVDRAKYMTPERFSASHILFKTDGRSRDEALKLAREARAKVIGGADFNELAREISEDPTAKRNQGRLDWFTAAEMDPAFAAGVAALKQPGAISEPVLSSFGWHLIKLEDRRAPQTMPFEEARVRIIAELREKRINEAREAALAKIRNDPTIRPHKEAIDALVIRVDQDAVRRAEKSVPGASGPAAK